jgi:hypothetical protein
VEEIGLKSLSKWLQFIVKKSIVDMIIERKVEGIASAFPSSSKLKNSPT